MRNKAILAQARFYTRIKATRLMLPIIFILSVPLIRVVDKAHINIFLFAAGMTFVNYVISYAYTRIKDGREQIKELLPNLRERYHAYLKTMHELCREAEQIKLAPLEDFADQNFLETLAAMKASHEKAALVFICKLEAERNKDFAFKTKLRESEHTSKLANILLSDLKLAEKIVANC